MGTALEHADLGIIPLMLGFIVVTGLVGMPLFMKLGVAPRLRKRRTGSATRRATSSPR
jgi:hypothetical protein